MNTNLPAVISEVKRLRDALSDTSGDASQRLKRMWAYKRGLFNHADTLLGAAEECERLREALDKIRQAEPCTHEGSCFYPRHDGDGNFISDDHVDPLNVIQDMVGIARAALEAKT